MLLAGLGTVSFSQIEPLFIGGNAADLEITLPAGAKGIALGDDAVPQDSNANTPNTGALAPYLVRG